MHIVFYDICLDKHEYRYQVVIHIDGGNVFSVYDGEPEDNNLGRNFEDVYNLNTVFSQIAEASERGERITFTKHPELSREEWDDLCEEQEEEKTRD